MWAREKVGTVTAEGQDLGTSKDVYLWSGKGDPNHRIEGWQEIGAEEERQTGGASAKHREVSEVPGFKKEREK